MYVRRMAGGEVASMEYGHRPLGNIIKKKNIPWRNDCTEWRQIILTYAWKLDFANFNLQKKKINDFYILKIMEAVQMYVCMYVCI